MGVLGNYSHVPSVILVAPVVLRKPKPNLLPNSSGSSLVQVMIAIGLLGAIAAAFADIMIQQRRDFKSMEQKQEILELKNLFLFNFNTATCTAQLKNLEFDGTLAGLANVSIPLFGTGSSELRLGADATAPVVAKVGNVLSTSKTNLQVSSIVFKKLSPTGNPDEFLGQIEIQFDSSSMIRSLKPLVVQKVVFAPETTAPTRKILNCVSVDSTQSTLTQNTKVYKATDLTLLTTTWECPLGGDCNVMAVRTYQATIATGNKDQYISVTASGMWDVTTCGSCAAQTIITYVINSGNSTSCAQAHSTGGSGPYRSAFGVTANCIVHVPANSTATITFTFDGRGGQKFNENVGTYDSVVHGETPVISFYSVN